MIDLHTHSHFSDGTDSPTELVRKAKKQKLEAIALCDHNTVAGLPEFMAAGKNSTVETIPGTELTAEFDNTEVHILALFLPETQYDAVTLYVDPFRKAKAENNRYLFSALTNAGFLLEEQRIFQGSLDYVNRAVFASELTRLGYTVSNDEAFQTLLKPGNGYYFPVPKLNAFETIEFIRSINAVPVLAHPLDSLTPSQLRVFLPEAVKAGLQAMETFYSKYDASETALACALAEAYALKQAGGSDYHGDRKPGILLGTGKGTLSIPRSVLEALRP